MKKILSLLLIAIIYIISFIVAYFVVYYLNRFLNSYLSLFIGTVLATIIIYSSSLFLKTASVYDPYWSLQPIFLLITYYLTNGIVLKIETLFVFLPLAIWSIRLTVNWITEFNDISFEDWRYISIRKNTKNNRFLQELVILIGVMLIPTIVVFFTTLPLFNIHIYNDLSFLIIGGFVILLATVLQMVSDIQMSLFRKKKTGTNIDSGLWKYSRHPNYFGELLVWTGVFIASISSFDWLNVIGIILVYSLFLFISIPLCEKRYLQKYENYRTYVMRTSKLLILPKRSKE